MSLEKSHRVITEDLYLYLHLNKLTPYIYIIYKSKLVTANEMPSLIMRTVGLCGSNLNLLLV